MLTRASWSGPAGRPGGEAVGAVVGMEKDVDDGMKVVLEPLVDGASVELVGRVLFTRLVWGMAIEVDVTRVVVRTVDGSRAVLEFANGGGWIEVVVVNVVKKLTTVVADSDVIGSTVGGSAGAVGVGKSGSDAGDVVTGNGDSGAGAALIDGAEPSLGIGARLGG